MATFVLIHGAADVGWYWHLVERELRRRGHDTLVPDLPCEDDSAGLAEYADTVVQAIGGRSDLIVVAQSFGGFTAPLVAARVPVDLLVLVTAMIPAPAEAPDDWSANTGFFPPEFMRPLVASRLGIVPDEITAGHAIALSRPGELASMLVGYLP